MLTKFLSNFFSKSKRIVQLGRQSLVVRETATSTAQQHMDVRKIGWQYMNLQQLSNLSSNTLQNIRNSISKNIVPLQEDQVIRQWSTVWKKLTLQSEQPQKAEGNVAQLYDLELDDQKFSELIVKFFKQLPNPQNLIEVCEPSFIKLLSKMAKQTQNSSMKIQQRDVKVDEMKPINIEYEFWVGAHRNRSRNSQPNRYVIQTEIIDNPNNSVLITEKDRKIQLKKIILKRRPEKFFTGLVIKVLFQVFLNSQRHYIKFEMLGPESVNNNVRKPLDTAIRIIDIDDIMGGNPTVQNIFKFY